MIHHLLAVRDVGDILGVDHYLAAKLMGLVARSNLRLM